VTGNSPSPGRHDPIGGALKGLYRRRLGMLQWIEAPPKTMDRASRDGDAFRAAAPGRAAEAEKIKEDLPHIAYVVRLYDPTWDPASAKPIRPHTKHRATPKPRGGWALAMLTVLRGTHEPLTVTEIVEAICDQHDIINETVSDRQRCHTAVTGALRTRSRQGLVIKHDGRPVRWSLKRS
jgi:hypothetical protein